MLAQHGLAVEQHGLDHLEAYDLDAVDGEALALHVRKHGADAIVSGLPYFCNVEVARIAADEGDYALAAVVRNALRAREDLNLDDARRVDEQLGQPRLERRGTLLRDRKSVV